jgi:transcriptional regulator with XRE-family HTH domain
MVTTLGSRIRELREQLDLSLREFAKKLGGISAAHISDIELGRRFPSDSLLQKMAALLRVSVDELRRYDARPPVEELKRLAFEDPAFGFALRKLVDKEVTSDDIMKLTRGKRDREKP